MLTGLSTPAEGPDRRFSDRSVQKVVATIRHTRYEAPINALIRGRSFMMHKVYTSSAC